MRVSGAGVAAELPVGWGAEIVAGVEFAAAGEVSPPNRLRVAHFANFPLPPERADFGADVVGDMRPGDVFVVLYEYEPSSVGQPLFAARGIPDVTGADFDRDTLQAPLPGQSGLQRFFQVAGRAFCLYVVIGSHVDRADVLPEIRAVVRSLEVT